MRKRLIHLLVFVFVVSLLSASTSLGFNAGPDPSLVGWWRLDDGAGSTVLDSSGNGNDGTISGNLDWVEGNIGGALYSNASGYVDCGNSPSLNPTDGITIALWIKSPGFGANNWGAFVAKGDTGSSYRFGRNGTGNACHFGLGGTSHDGTVVVADDEWHHIAATYDGALMQIWVDDVPDTSLAHTGQINTSTVTCRIGENGDATGRTVVATFDDVRIYNRALTAEELAIVLEGEHVPIAVNPSPADEATDVPRDVVLSWIPGPYAASHNVYFGNTFDDVNSADESSLLLVSPGQDANVYDPPGRLEFAQTYYWRVDEVNAPPSSTVFKGKTWSFTVEPALYAIEDIVATASLPTGEGSGGPEATVDGSGLIDGEHGLDETTMWSCNAAEGGPIWIQYDFDRVYKVYQIHIWNYNNLYEGWLGLGFKDVTIEYAVEPNEWMTLGDFQLDPGTSKATYVGQTIGVDGLPMRSARITAASNFKGLTSYGLSEVQFLQKPVCAREPQPDDGATEVSQTTSLSWRPGREAVSHQVHFSSDSNAVAEGTALIDTVAATTYSPGTLDIATTYYWKIGEVNEVETPTAWDSAVWSFTTQQHIVLDDFESYTDDAGNEIFMTWEDGYNVGANGSQVGHDDPPYAEQTIRHGDAQSMPFRYENIDGATISETEFAVEPAQDWTAWNIKSLSLFFYGTAGNTTTAQFYIKINGTEVPYDGDTADLAQELWHPWNIDLSTAGGDFTSVTKLTIGVAGAGATGQLYIDDVRLYSTTPEYIDPVQPSAEGLAAHYTFDEGSGTTVADSSGNGNHGTVQGDPLWVPGIIGGAMEFSGNDYVDCGNSASLVIRDAITVACWIKVQAFVNGWEAIIAMGDNSYRMSRSEEFGNSIHFGCNGPSGGDLNSTPEVTTNTWRHVALVYDGAYRYIYIDGIEVIRLASTGQIDASTYNLYIGANSQQADRFFHGLIDDVRIYSRALSPGEVAGLAGRTLPVAVAF
ncbi:MAG: hypothetical protein JW955_02015 [Sedimentisphaerales bacterium]|nr:hypothetical protein [Sedimentisphaerales bacterium]